MPTVTDCERWLDNVKVESDDAVYSLYNTVSDEAGCGGFQCSSRGQQLYIRSSSSEDWLLIASEPARKQFLDMLKIRFCGGQDVPAWYTSKGESMSRTG